MEGADEEVQKGNLQTALLTRDSHPAARSPQTSSTSFPQPGSESSLGRNPEYRWHGQAWVQHSQQPTGGF